MLRKEWWIFLNPTVSLIFNQDGTYDLILNYEQNGMKLSKEFDLKKEAHKISKSIFSNKELLFSLKRRYLNFNSN